MKSRTIVLPPGRVAPGMTLAEPVYDRERHQLLAAGTVLDTRTLDRLSQRGIEAVAVLLLDTRDEDTIAHELHNAESRVARIFRGEGSPARAALQAAILDYRRQTTR
jgi:hypothetical protein